MGALYVVRRERWLAFFREHILTLFKKFTALNGVHVHQGNAATKSDKMPPDHGDAARRASVSSAAAAPSAIDGPAKERRASAPGALLALPGGLGGGEGKWATLKKTLVKEVEAIAPPAQTKISFAKIMSVVEEAVEQLDQRMFTMDAAEYVALLNAIGLLPAVAGKLDVGGESPVAALRFEKKLGVLTKTEAFDIFRRNSKDAELDAVAFARLVEEIVCVLRTRHASLSSRKKGSSSFAAVDGWAVAAAAQTSRPSKSQGSLRFPAGVSMDRTQTSPDKLHKPLAHDSSSGAVGAPRQLDKSPVPPAKARPPISEKIITPRLTARLGVKLSSACYLSADDIKQHQSAPQTARCNTATNHTPSGNHTSSKNLHDHGDTRPMTSSLSKPTSGFLSKRKPLAARRSTCSRMFMARVESESGYKDTTLMALGFGGGGLWDSNDGNRTKGFCSCGTFH
jgi:hypothetical protein